MPRIKSKSGEEPIELQMTPMIDVIFQLLIFFMCATRFKSLEGKFLTYMPENIGIVSDEEIPPLQLDEVRIKLIYDETAAVKTRIRVKLSTLEYALNDWDELYRDMADKYEKHRLAGIEIPFLIDPDPEVPFQAVVSALNACRKARIMEVGFTTKTP